MSRERDLLVSCLDKLKYHKVPCSDDLIRTIQWVLAEPEEEGVYQKLLRIEKENYVEMLPSELWQDGYEAGKRSVLLSKQPEQHGTQYLLDQVARLTAENAMLKEKRSTSKQPEQNKAGAIMPNGVCVSNVYDAYEEGRKSVIVEQEPLLAETKIEWYGKGFRQGVNEFAPPNPLTGDAIYALDKEGIVENMGDHQVRYVLGWIRSVEKAHGIGGGE